MRVTFNCLWISATISTTALPALAQADNDAKPNFDPAAIDLIRSAARAHAEDWEHLRHSKGSATCEWESADGKRYWDCDLDFEIHDHAMWMHLVTTDKWAESPMDFSELELVADGKSLAVVRHSDRIRPIGCEVGIRKDKRKNLRWYGQMLAFDLRNFIAVSALRTDPTPGMLEHAKAIHFSEDGPPARTVIVAYENNDLEWRYRFDSEWGNRLVALESVVPVADVPMASYVMEYDVGEKSVVYPAVITYREISMKDRSSQHTLIYSINRLTPHFSTTRTFNLDSLNICSGARAIDRRPGSEVQVRNAAPSIISHTASESIASQVAKLPERYPRTSEPIKPERTGRLVWLVAVNAVLLTIGAWYWFYRSKT